MFIRPQNSIGIYFYQLFNRFVLNDKELHCTFRSFRLHLREWLQNKYQPSTIYRTNWSGASQVIFGLPLSRASGNHFWVRWRSIEVKSMKLPDPTELSSRSYIPANHVSPNKYKHMLLQDMGPPKIYFWGPSITSIPILTSNFYAKSIQL